MPVSLKDVGYLGGAFEKVSWDPSKTNLASSPREVCEADLCSEVCSPTAACALLHEVSSSMARQTKEGRLERKMAGLVSVLNLPAPESCRPRLLPLPGMRRFRDRGGGDHVPRRRRAVPPPPPPGLPPEGRVHQRVQTELYLEELWLYPTMRSVACQTNIFLERQESPLFVPVKTGVDAETQILPGELFHFDSEVLAILEVLADKTMEQALLEVLEEEEMASLRAQQRRYLAARDVELTERQRLEDQERRLREEADRRVDQARAALRHQAEARDRVAAAVLVRGHLQGLLPSVLQGLADAGVLVDDVRADVVDGFLPWLVHHVNKRTAHAAHGRLVLDQVLKDVLVEQRRAYSQLERARLEESSPRDESPDESASQVSDLLEDLTNNLELPPDPVVAENDRAISTILEESEDVED